MNADSTDAESPSSSDPAQAIELIYKHRPDVQTALRDELEALLKGEPDLILDYPTMSRIRFTVRDWDRPALLKAKEWTPSERILLFEFWNDPDKLQLKLMVGPGEEETRRKLFEMVRANPGLFQSPRSTDVKHGRIFSRRFLGRRMYEEGVSDDEREGEIRRRWAEFLDEDLPRIEAALKEERWIWEPA